MVELVTTSSLQQRGLNNIVATSADLGDYLGRIITASFADFIILRSDLEEQYANLNLPDWILPALSSSTPPSCFKRSIRTVKIKDIRKKEGTVKYLFRDFGLNNKRLVREFQDLNGDVLNYIEIGEFKLIGNGRKHRTKRNPCGPSCAIHYPYTLISNLLDPAYKEYHDYANKEIRAEYQLQLNGVVESQMRSVLNNFFYQTSSTRIRSTGGVWFVPEKYASLVAKLSKLFDWINKHDGKRSPYDVEIVEIPVVNDSDRRALIERKFKSDTADKVKKLLDIIKEKRKGEGWTAKEFASYNGELQKIINADKHYMKILSQTESFTKDAVNEVKKALGQDIDDDLDQYVL